MLQAGIARIDCTPPTGVRLVGYLDRDVPADRVNDDLAITALALHADGGCLLLCADVLGLPGEVCTAVRTRIAALCGVSPVAVWFAPSHTHSGPPTDPGASANDLERRWAAEFPELLVEAARTAWENLAPARLRRATCDIDVGANRRLLGADGRVAMMAEAEGRPVDRRAVAVAVETTDGKPVGVLVNVATHPVASGRATRYVSADYPGALRRALEAAGTGPCAFTLGACGDVNPRDGIHEDPRHARELGERAAAALLGALDGASIVPVETIRTAARQLRLSYRRSPHAPPPPVEHLTEVLECGPDQLDRLLDERFPWRSPVDADDAVLLEIAVTRIGPICLAAVGYELFAATGARLRQSLGSESLVITLANASIGYLPPQDELPRGGYEVDESFLLYRLPGPPPADGEARVVDAVRELVEAAR